MKAILLAVSIVSFAGCSIMPDHAVKVRECENTQDRTKHVEVWVQSRAAAKDIRKFDCKQVVR